MHEIMNEERNKLKLYLKCKHTEHKSKHQALVRNVTQQHLQRGQIGQPHFVIRAVRG